MNDEKLVQDVINAWKVEGVSPVYHRHKQIQLRIDWPTLSKALDKLVSEVRGDENQNSLATVRGFSKDTGG